MAKNKVCCVLHRLDVLLILDNRWVSRVGNGAFAVGAAGTVEKVAKHRLRGADALTLASLGLLALGVALHVASSVARRRRSRIAADAAAQQPPALALPSPPPDAQAPPLPLVDWLARERKRGVRLLEQIAPPRGYLTAPGDDLDFTVETAQLEKRVRLWAVRIRRRLAEEAPCCVAAFDAGADLPPQRTALRVMGTATRAEMRAFLAAKLLALDRIGGDGSALDDEPPVVAPDRVTGAS
jgi:hypothetical protein